MRLGKAERAIARVEASRKAQARLRASMVPDTPGRFASMCGQVMATGARKFNHTGWNSSSARRIGKANA